MTKSPEDASEAQKKQKQCDSPLSSPTPSISPSIPCRRIGYVKSCFTHRFGTPRQGLLVPAAKSVLVFDRQMVDTNAALDGLSDFSYIWVLFWFHENVPSSKADPSQGATIFKGKVCDWWWVVVMAQIRPPRLGGKRVGVFCSRSPHRPNPIALSLAKVERVEAGKGLVIVSGLDAVNGSPILDIKPYIPHYDDPTSVHTQSVLALPAWSNEKKEEAPRVASWMTDVAFECFSDVVVLDTVADMAKSLLSTRKGDFVYGRHEVSRFIECVRQLLSFDIRSLHQKTLDFETPNNHYVYSMILDDVKVRFKLFTNDHQLAPDDHVIVGSGQERVMVPEAATADNSGTMNGALKVNNYYCLVCVFEEVNTDDDKAEIVPTEGDTA